MNHRGGGTVVTQTRYVASIILIAIGLLLFQINAFAQSFSRTDYPLLGNNHIVADFNGDGIPDLAGAGASSVGVMLGNANGIFRPRVQFPAGGPAQDLTSGDFNGDGRTDLAVSINDPTVSLALLTGNGDGTFNAPVTFQINTARVDSPAIVATDLDNDGRLDLVLAHAISCFTSPCSAARTITVLLGFGDGTFQFPIEIEVGTGMSRIAVGDFNRDTIKDLAIAGDRSQVYTLLGVGNGTFLQQPTLTLTADTLGVDGTDIDAGDLNGDTIADLVVAIPTNGSRTAVLLGNGDGTFQAPRIITEPNLRVPQFQVIADFNGDNIQDLAITLANGSQGLMEIRNGNGDGTFRAPVLYAVPPPLSSVGGGTIVTGDFNRDGKPDVGLPVIGANPSLSVLLNSTGNVVVAPVLGTLTATPSTVASGNLSELRISLSQGVAPSGGYTFSTSSSNSAVLSVPSSVFMAAGTSSVTFNGTARNVTSNQSAIVRVRNDQIGRREVTVTVTPGAPPPPTPVSLSSVTLSAASVVGGNPVQGTVRLSAAASSATVVNLASSSASATVPASVTVAAGSSSATFTVNTTAVSATTTATISGTFNGLTRSATLTINTASAPPPPPATDTVRITRAEFDSSKRILRVEASSTSASATLQVFNTGTGALIGTLSSGRGEFSVSTNPQNITVRSSLGGVATRAVDAK
jgi:hypothetical protein